MCSDCKNCPIAEALIRQVGLTSEILADMGEFSQASALDVLDLVAPRTAQQLAADLVAILGAVRNG